MSDANKSGDNRLFQLTIVLITAVIGPLAVFFVTNNAKNAPASPTAVPAIITVTQSASQPAATAVATAAAELKPTESSQPAVEVPSGIENPKGTVLAGTQARMDEMALWIEPGDVQAGGESIGLRIHIRNLGSGSRTISYSATALTVRDDTGKTYAIFSGPKAQCKKQDVDKKREIQIGAQQEVVLQSAADNASAWCADASNMTLPLYSGPVSSKAQVLRIEIKGIGPFQGFTVEVKP